MLMLSGGFDLFERLFSISIVAPPKYDLPDSWQPFDRAKPPPRRRMTPHGNLFSMPLSPPHSRIGGMDRESRIGTNGQKR